MLFISRKTIVHRIVLAVVLGVGLWAVVAMITFFFAADAVRRLPVGASMDMMLGPLSLVHVVKIAQSNGFTLALSMRSGLLLLGLICCAVEVSMVVLPYVLQVRHHKTMSHLRGK